MSFQTTKPHLILYGDTTTFHPALPDPKPVAVHPFCLDAWKTTLEKAGLVAGKHFSIVKNAGELDLAFQEVRQHILIIPGGHAVSLSHSFNTTGRTASYIEKKMYRGSLSILGSCSGAIRIASMKESPFLTDYSKRPFELAGDKGRIVKVLPSPREESKAFGSFWNAGMTFQLNPNFANLLFHSPETVSTYPEAKDSIAGFSFAGPRDSIFMGLGFHPEIGPVPDPETINTWTDPVPAITLEENEQRRQEFLSSIFKTFRISQETLFEIPQEEELPICY